MFMKRVKIAIIDNVLKNEWVEWFRALAIYKKQGTECTQLLHITEPILSDCARQQKASRSLKRGSIVDKRKKPLRQFH